MSHNTCGLAFQKSLPSGKLIQRIPEKGYAHPGILKNIKKIHDESSGKLTGLCLTIDSTLYESRLHVFCPIEKKEMIENMETEKMYLFPVIPIDKKEMIKNMETEKMYLSPVISLEMAVENMEEIVSYKLFGKPQTGEIRFGTSYNKNILYETMEKEEEKTGKVESDPSPA